MLGRIKLLLQKLLHQVFKKYKEWRFSITYAFAFFTTLVVLIPLTIVGVYFHQSISKNLKNSANNYLTYYIEAINKDIESQFRIIDNTAMLFLSNPTLRDIFGQQASENQYVSTKNTIDMDYLFKYMLFFNYAWDSKLINSVFAIKDEATFYYILRDPVQKKQIQNNIDVYKRQIGFKGEKYLVPPTVNDPTIYFVCNINDINTLEYQGKLIFSIHQEKLFNVNKDAFQFKNAEIITFNDQGVIFSHTRKGLLGQKVDNAFYRMKDLDKIVEVKTDSETYFAKAIKIDKYGLTSIIAVPKSEVFLNLSTSMQYYMGIIILIALSSLILGLSISTRITKPLKHLMRNITAVKNRKFDSKMPSYQYLELDQLSSIFNNMTDEINHLINQVYEKQLLVKESELKFLQSQVNPHFLFNVLETVSWHARMSDNENIYRMVTSLGELLRANINLGSSEKIKIRKELEYIGFYLDLQKFRFADRLHIEIIIADEDILEYYLPRLCIQPIIENAIIHGLESKRGKGLLKIQVWEEEEEIYFSIIDNGVGFNSKELRLDDVDPALLRKTGHTSIGLYNANKRIKLLYGESYGIKIDSKPNEGTKVIVCIPIDKEVMSDVSYNDCR